MKHPWNFLLMKLQMLSNEKLWLQIQGLRDIVLSFAAHSLRTLQNPNNQVFLIHTINYWMSNHNVTSTGLQSILKRRLKYLNLHHHSDWSGWRYYYTSNWRVVWSLFLAWNVWKIVISFSKSYHLFTKALMEDFQILHHFIWTRFCRHDYPLPAKNKNV